MARPSQDAVEAATGRGWAEWFARLDVVGGRDADHKGIVQMLVDEGVESGWWRQSVTVAYEQETGRRLRGQTDAGFQVGVRRTLPLARDAMWNALVGRCIGTWLPGVQTLPGVVGDAVVATDGTEYELRCIDPQMKLRLRVTRPDGASPTTLQVYLLEGSTGTSVGFHQEGLAGADERAAAKEHWAGVAEDLRKQLAP